MYRSLRYLKWRHRCHRQAQSSHKDAAVVRGPPAGSALRKLGGASRGTRGNIMHSMLSSSWTRRLLLALVSVVAFATAAPTTSLAQTIQGLGFLPGGENQTRAQGVNA